MANRQYRCIVNALKIRTQPRLGSIYETGQTLKRGELITAEDAQRVESEGYTWVRHARGWSAARSVDGRVVYLTDAVAARDRVWGINIDPNNPTANPPAARLTGTGWVRFVMHVESRRETLEQAFAFYDPIIRSYAQNGTRIILILLQDTYRGNIPWLNGDWPAYWRGFAERAGQIARRYRGQVAVYQIWNEGDTQNAETSIYVTPVNYAGLLLAAAQVIAMNDPAARVITQGLASGLESSISYMRQVQATLGGFFPADGIAVHPYAHVPPDPAAPPFPGWRASLDNLMRRFSDSFPGMPIWITEFGVPNVDVNDQTLWPRIAVYMDKTIDFLRETYNHIMPAAVWFAWADSMANAGIVNNQGQAKNQIFASFFRNMHDDYPPFVRPSATPYDGRLTITHFAGEPLPERTIPDLALRLANTVPNARSFLLRSSVGTFWQTRPGTLGVSGPAELATWVDALARYRIALHAWHELHGANPAEVGLISQIIETNGVASLVFDLNPVTLTLRTAEAIRNYMITLRRRALPVGFHVALSFDGRPSQFGAVNLLEWLPFIDSWLPKILHRDYGQTPAALMQATFDALRPFRKPILPILQLDTADVLRGATRLATEQYNVPGVMYWRLATGDPTPVNGMVVPWLAGYVPAPSLGVLTVRTTQPVRVRVVPSESGETLGLLEPGTQITVLEKRSMPPLEWVRHRAGWSAARNTVTGEVFMA